MLFHGGSGFEETQNDCSVFGLAINDDMNMDRKLMKRPPEFKLDGYEGSEPSDTEEVGSLGSDSDEESPNPTIKTKKEPKKVVSQSAEFLPCVIIMTQVFVSCVFDVKSFLAVTKVQQQVFHALLCRILSPGGLQYLKSALETKQDSLKLRPEDFSKNNSDFLKEFTLINLLRHSRSIIHSNT